MSSTVAPGDASSSVSNPQVAAPNQPQQSQQSQQSDAGSGHRRRRHRHKKRRNRRQSFATPLVIADADPRSLDEDPGDSHLVVPGHSAARSSFYRLGKTSSVGNNLSTTSIESSALLDHRHQQPMPTRRPSTLGQLGRRPSYPPRSLQMHPHDGSSSAYRQSLTSSFRPGGQEHPQRSGHSRAHDSSGDSDDDEDAAVDDRTPLISLSASHRQDSIVFGGDEETAGGPRRRRSSNATSTSSRRHLKPMLASQSSWGGQGEYNVNYPPSVPGSPKLEPHRSMGFDDVMLTESFSRSRSPERRRPRDSVIDMSGGAGMDPYCAGSTPPSPTSEGRGDRRRPVALQAEEDVCFPVEGMSEIADDESPPTREGSLHIPGRRGRGRRWPDLEVLEDWSQGEKEQRSEGIRAKKISEPVLVGGRLRPSHKAGWHRIEEDAPYRFTYFNEEFAGTIHSQTISELLQPGQTFQELFIPDPPVLSNDSSDNEGEELPRQDTALMQRQLSTGHGDSNFDTRTLPVVTEWPLAVSPDHTSPPPPLPPSPPPKQKREPQVKPKRYGARPTFWLDVLSPTEAEMKVLSKAFAIHPLTSEDIMMQEAREKVELFRNYYFVNYRTFDQDTHSEHYLEPINMYVVVFREGVISFHFSMTPHPANVRRRIRQLKDYLILSGDWISYAIIDDITDVFVPLIQSVEDEVDEIDDIILQLHSSADHIKGDRVKGSEMKSEAGGCESGNMLRRVGDCRKKVMGLYRLLGNKADVIKGFAKRCNEQWEVAPRSEIGLYLGDIQDHIVTMTSNLSHYENHSNYLAQINIRMGERQEQTADVLGRLTVLGTIVLPMNIITGLWGMNVLVPGQDIESLNWFWSSTFASPSILRYVYLLFLLWRGALLT
ncbi:hypothetical protein FGG08_006650 [Glutinoglossum americanum]|uniref:Uncharacterized protein n=1 Tax=Glutinoglossum americanum TaxID=1670608 RepID=A0A9P8KX86_9PEZI|nr:hypothetical protein FGG08_006650 [Glutinoglossum americanum]